MRCKRCGNEDSRFFEKDYGTYYCRKCISFSRLDVGNEIKKCTLDRSIFDVEPVLEYQLTQKQKDVSSKALYYLKKGYDVFVFAATGAGKTEITFESICCYLKEGKKVCFSISRRQVVLEIAQRLRIAFPTLRIVEVTQGYTKITDGDIIICTMHQLYRYAYGIDLLIMDEIDAFPYVNNELLEAVVNQACIGQKLCLSATPDDKSKQWIKEGKMKVVTLFERPHKKPLVVPRILQLNTSFQIIYIVFFCYKQIKEKNKYWFMFLDELTVYG